MVPLGRDAVEIAKAGVLASTVMLSVIVADLGGLAESVAPTVIADVPAAVGVPVIAPVLGFRVKPAGSVPVARLQVTALIPPIACKVALYAVFRTPSGSEVVVMMSCRASTMGEPVAEVNFPVPSPRKMETESSFSFTTAKSCIPSPLKSPVAIPVGLEPTGIATGF